MVPTSRPLSYRPGVLFKGRHPAFRRVVLICRDSGADPLEGRRQLAIAGPAAMRQVRRLAVILVAVQMHHVQPAPRVAQDAAMLTAYRVLSAIPFRPIG